MYRKHLGKRRDCNSATARCAVRRLAAQARLWKMAPDEMDSRYESLLRRCSATERRFRVTTVSDVLAGITGTLSDTVDQRKSPLQLPPLVPCNLAYEASDETLVALEDEMTVDSISQEENQILDLSGQNPTVITLVSPSTSSPPDESRYQGGRRKERVEATQYSARREQKSRRARRTPVTSYYPKMSWKRAHEGVQRRKRESKRRKSPYRPLETNPGWTPLQMAILRSGILGTPATLSTVYPDSPANGSDVGRSRDTDMNDDRSLSHQDQLVQNEPLGGHNQNETPPFARDFETEVDGSRSNNTHRDPILPSTPEVVVRQRKPRSFSVFSDSSPCSKHTQDQYDNSGNDSLEEDDMISYPRGTSTPICSAMELFLNAEPFVPRLNNFDDSTLSTDSWKHGQSPPCTVPIQETCANDQTSHLSESTISEMGKTPDGNNPSGKIVILPMTQTIPKMGTSDNPPVQCLIPVIEHGIVKERVDGDKKMVDVRATQDWIVSKRFQQDAHQKQQKIKLQDLRDIVVPNRPVFPVHETQQGHQPSGRPGIQTLDTHRTVSQGIQQPQGLTQAFVFIQNAASQLPHSLMHPHVQQQHQQQQHHQQLQSPQMAGQSGFNVPRDAHAHLHQLPFPHVQQNGNVGFPRQHTAPAVNHQWQPQQQQQQQQQQQTQQHQQQQMHFGDIIRLGTGGAPPTQFPNNQAWGPQQMSRGPPQPLLLQQRPPQPLLQGQLHNLQQRQQQQHQQQHHLQQQQQQQQQQQAAYRHQHLHNATGARSLLDNIGGNNQHAGFNNNNFGHQHQQLVQPVHQQVPNFPVPSTNHQQAQPNTIPSRLPAPVPSGGAHRFPLGPSQWQARY